LLKQLEEAELPTSPGGKGRNVWLCPGYVLASEGIKLDQGLFETLQFACTRQAEDTLRAYGTDAAMNGLAFPRHEEETAWRPLPEAFARRRVRTLKTRCFGR
jgi:hypothetical protein